MLGRRRGESRRFAKRRVVHEPVKLMAHEAVTHIVVEAYRPIVGELLAAAVKHQIVHHVAAAEDQDAFVTQGREPPANFEMVSRWPANIDAELHDGNTSLGVGFAQHGPGAVIQPPGLVLDDRQGGQELGNPARQLRIARRGIADVENGLREAAKVVDGRRPLHGGHPETMSAPMGRNGENRPRRGNIAGQTLPALRPYIVGQDVERRAVAQKNRRHPLHCAAPFIVRG